MIKLTEDQEKAVRLGNDYIDGNIFTDKKWITISGAGGTGKTLVTKYIVNAYKSKSVLGIAISNAAVKQLAFGLERESITLAKALNRKPVLNKKTGKKEFKTNASLFAPPPLNGYDILIIDECSMLSDKDIEEIVHYSREGSKIIMLGDQCQHKPIDGDKERSTSFDNTIIELRQIMRFKEPLDVINQQYRNQVLDYFEKGIKVPNHYSFKDVEVNGSGVYNLNDREDLINTFIKYYDPTNIKAARIIAFKNKTIDEYNSTIRRRALGAGVEQYIEGDLLLANKPYMESAIKNNETVRVLKVKLGNYNGIPHFILDVITENDTFIKDVFVLDKDDLRQYYSELKKYKKAKDWFNYYKLEEKFFHCSYGFAGTSYKMQGSTIENVFVDNHEIQTVRPLNDLEKMQTCYVGVSRASKNIFVLNK